MSPKTAFLFPGQGSQFVGMGQDLVAAFPEAARCFEQADDVLGFPLSRLCFEGPIEELTQTRNAQPAILVHGVAVQRVLAANGVAAPDAVAGHSLGEFSAACAAGVMSLADAVRIVRRRGELMWEAGQQVPGTMAAVMGLDVGECERICAEVSASGVGVVVVANRNSPAQVVLSGDVAAVEAVAEPLKAAGARRVVGLPVSGAFHSPLLEAAGVAFGGFLSGVPLRAADPPLVANVTGLPITAAEDLRASFVGQLTAPVRWHESVERMVADGVRRFVEVGPGTVLTNLGARGFGEHEFLATSDLAGVEKVLALLGKAG